ncbi:hypothetical protein BH09VER1_BH09VER1_49370 [soil metagenome]
MRRLLYTVLLSGASFGGASRLLATIEQVELSALDQQAVGRYLVVQTDMPGHAETYRRVFPSWAVWDAPEGLIFAGRLDGIMRDSLFLTLPVEGSDSRQQCIVGKKHVVKMWLKDDYAYRAEINEILERNKGLEIRLSLRKHDSPNGSACFLLPPESAYYPWLHSEMARVKTEQIYCRIILNVPMPRERIWPFWEVGVVTKQTAKDLSEFGKDSQTRVLKDSDIVSIHGITQNEYLQVQPRIVKP